MQNISSLFSRALPESSVKAMMGDSEWKWFFEGIFTFFVITCNFLRTNLLLCFCATLVQGILSYGGLLYCIQAYIHEGEKTNMCKCSRIHRSNNLVPHLDSVMVRVVTRSAESQKNNTQILKYNFVSFRAYPIDSWGQDTPPSQQSPGGGNSQEQGMK